jgi:hypothetical protein
MIDRIMKEDMVGAGRDRLRLLHFERLEAMYASIEPEVVKDDGTPVDEKKVLAAIKILEREARMTGIDGPTVVEQDENDEEGEGSRAMEEKIEAVQTWVAFCDERDRPRPGTTLGSSGWHGGQGPSRRPCPSRHEARPRATSGCGYRLVYR